MLRILLTSLCLLALPALSAEPVRTELARHPAPGSQTHEVIISRLDVPPGATVPRHIHAGDEHLYVLIGGQMQAPNGQGIPFAAGHVAHFPEGQPDGGLTHVGDAPLVALTTHIVEIGEPLNLPVE